ncbi:putative UDP-glucose glucosyltransferase [Senna tora]|uniref:Glycosyltransferase n=1 Tax=Senna tora TaxID=362788 RepID=A0A834SVG4_9FABA|nr:putative UDP-glucose glucosyltransferase [Senna tora]
MGSESESEALHALLVSFPAQGHINPLLRLGKRLASKGLLVTFSTNEKTGRSLRTANDVVSSDNPIPVGPGFLRFEFFDDGWADDDPRRKNLADLLPQLELSGKQFVSQFIKKHNNNNNNNCIPISLIINNPFVPWVCDVASEHNLPCAVLWVQSGAVFTTYYHYFHKLVPFPSESDPSISVNLPHPLPLLKHNEIPSFLHPSSPYKFLGTLILEQFKNLSKPFCVLMDTFEELEEGYIRNPGGVDIRCIGPLFKSGGDGDGRRGIRGDLVVKDDECVEWLGSRGVGSVVYISFGSVVYVGQEQVDEIAYGLLEAEVSFLWVLKPPSEELGLESLVLPPDFLHKTKDKGKVVQWSPQEEVLAHPSVACFVTHCGWNSSMEAISCGIPVLTFPAWGDQLTNAKFLVEVFRVGIRLGDHHQPNKLITRDQVKNCLMEATIGPKAEDLKKNALRWKDAAEAAVAQGGSSDRNLDAFLDDVKRFVSNSANILNTNQKRESLSVI